MNALQIVQIIFAVATIATGLVSLVVPRSVRGFTGLDVSNARGITEIRAILGGAFIGLGAAPLIFHILEGYTFAHVAYQTLGITYLTIFVVRIIGMALDKSWVQSNYISLATEIVLGIRAGPMIVVALGHRVLPGWDTDVAACQIVGQVVYGCWPSS